MNVAQPLIHIHDFHMHFAAKKVINVLSIDAARGETVGFQGSTGSGKRTAIRAVMPTAKDAGTVFGPVMITLFIPLTAPITAMLRNAFGLLDGVSATILIAELFICGAVGLRVAVHLFRYGSIEYSRKLSLRTAFARKP